jgi:6-phosphogluconolactonase
MDDIRWHCFPDAQSVADETVQRILKAARHAVEQRGEFRLVLAGGSTPRLVYRQLNAINEDCSRWHIYLGDERCLPPEDGDRNSWMIRNDWLDHAAIPGANIHWIPAELGPEEGARRYEGQVSSVLPFDLVMLGMGEDGHTASLFPGQEHDQSRLVVPVYQSPKPPPERVSLNFNALSQTRELLVLVTGEGKRGAVRAWRANADLPVAALCCDAGVDVLLDHKAAGEPS